MRAHKRLGAVQIDLLGFQHQHRRRQTSADREPLTQLQVVVDGDRPVDPQGLVDARDHEDRRRPGSLNQIRQRIQPVVARPIGDQHGVIVMDLDEAGSITTRRDVHAPVGADRCQQQKG